MKNLYRLAGLAAVVLLSACVSNQTREQATAEPDPCVPKDPIARCISGEELRRFHGSDTQAALREALFPWVQ